MSDKGHLRPSFWVDRGKMIDMCGVICGVPGCESNLVLGPTPDLNTLRFQEAGWRHTVQWGWICPKCAAKMVPNYKPMPTDLLPRCRRCGEAMITQLVVYPDARTTTRRCTSCGWEE